jgi:hypothetical protein
LVQPGYLFWFSLDNCFGSAWIIVLVQPGYLYRRHLSKYPWTFALLAYQNVIHITCLAPVIDLKALFYRQVKLHHLLLTFLHRKREIITAHLLPIQRNIRYNPFRDISLDKGESQIHEWSRIY